MKFKIIALSTILSCFFTILYVYIFTTILYEPSSIESSVVYDTIYYNQIGCFKNPNTMITILETNDIEYSTYSDGEYTYIISGISNDYNVTNENKILLNSKSINSINKTYKIMNDDSNLDNVIKEIIKK